MRRTWMAALALALVAGCGGSTDDAVDGGTTFDDGQVTFEVPSHFERTPTGEELTDGLEVEFLHDRADDQPVPEHVSFGYGVPDDPTFSIVAWPAFAFGPMVGDNEQTARDEVDVDGATEALRVEYRIHRPDLDEPLRIVAVGALVDGPDGPLIADLRYYAVESQFDRGVVDEVVASFRASG